MSFRGKIKLEGEKKGDLGEYEILSFNYHIESPRDNASGLPTGRRKHSAIEVKVLMRGQTIQILDSLIINEKLQNCTLIFDQSDLRSGFETIKIARGSVSYYEQSFDSFTADAFIVTMRIIALEIEFESSDGGFATQDQWDINT